MSPSHDMPDGAHGDESNGVFSWVQVDSNPADYFQSGGKTPIIMSGSNNRPDSLRRIRVEFGVSDGTHVRFDQERLRWKSVILSPGGATPNRAQCEATVDDDCTDEAHLAIQRKLSYGDQPMDRAPRTRIEKLTFQVTIV